MQLTGRFDRPAFAVYHLLWGILDLLYPPTCGGCEKPGERWCENCRKQVKRSALVCPICGGVDGQGQICADCQLNPPPFQALRSCSTYAGPLREAIHRLKYQKDIGLGEILANHLIELYLEQAWEIDLVTVVPLSRKRLQQRGYNQAGMLARPLALYIKKPYQPGILKRIRDTTSQVTLNAQQRSRNVAGAFQANAKMAAGKKILIIDDVTTTGATMQACSSELLDAGAEVVYGLTLARADKHTDFSDAPQASSV
jgi:competence protein ComFC